MALENKQTNKQTSIVLAHMRTKGWEGREGKERNMCTRMEKKIPFVGLEPTPSAIRADVLIQLD